MVVTVFSIINVGAFGSVFVHVKRFFVLPPTTVELWIGGGEHLARRNQWISINGYFDEQPFETKGNAPMAALFFLFDRIQLHGPLPSQQFRRFAL